MAATVSTRITRLAAISPRTTAINLQTDLTIGDFRLGADYMRDAANTFGFASTVTAGDDVRHWAGAAFADRATAVYRLYESGALFCSNATISGAITATTGAIGGFTIGADYMRDAANSFGLASTVTAGDDVRFWAGSTFADRATAPLRMYESGAIIGANYASAASGKRIDIGATTPGELQFYADLGSGSVVLAATIGIRAVGADDTIGYFGSQASTNTNRAIYAESYNLTTIAAVAAGPTGTALYGISLGGGAAVAGFSFGSGTGIYGGSTTGYAGNFDGSNSVSAVHIRGGTGQYALELDGTGTAYIPGYIDGLEMTAPAAPAANGYRIYAQDNGAGKTQLMAIFNTGAAQQIAIQP